MMTEAVEEARRRLTAKILADAIGDPKSMVAAQEDGQKEDLLESEDMPRRRRGRREQPVDGSFPYDDADHRGDCGSSEVSQ